MKKVSTGIKKKSIIVGIAFFCIAMAGCGNTPEKSQDTTPSEAKGDVSSKDDTYGKYEAEFIGTFDVKTQIVGYSKSEDTFKEASTAVHKKMEELNNLFDIYNDYDGISNLKTINDNAGVKSVTVDPQIIDLLKISKEAYQKTDGLTNVAMGAVLRIWHDYRIEGIDSPEDAKLPPLEALKEATEHTNIDDVIIDEENNTVYLADSKMSLDVGAIAKGYAAEKAKDAAVLAGFESGIVDPGGNVVAVGEPKDGVRQRWGIGIQDPKKTVDGVSNILDTVYLNNMAVVTSGAYQRFYEVEGMSYNHIIDPGTLYPAERFAAVTVIHESSTEAELLSTAIFIAPYEKGLEIAETYGAEVIWVYPDGETKATKGYKKISKMYSGYSATDQ